MQIIPTTEGIKGELEQALGGAGTSAGESAGKNFSSGLGKGIAAAGAAAAAATAAVSAAVVKGVKDTAAYGDNIDKMSQKMGLSAEAYQEWDFIMQHAGTSINSLKSGMKTLASAAQTNSDAFEQLGISQQDIANMSQEELFSATLTALQNVQSETERTYLAGQLLGRGATELGPLLNMSAEEVDAMRQQVHDLGGVMSNDAVKASANYADSLQNLQTSVQGISRGMLQELLPGAVQVMDGLTAVFSGDSSGIAKIKEGVSSIAKSFTELLPQLLDIVKDIAISIVKALPEILPDIIKATVSFFVDAIPELIDAGIQLFNALVEAMPQIIDQIVQALPEIISSIVTALISNIPAIAKAGLELLLGLIKEIPQVIAKIGQTVGMIIKALVDGFKNSLEKIKDIGKNIVEGIWTGIKNMATTFANNVKNFFTGIVDGVKSLLGIHSPSKVFAGIGGYMAEGLGDGFTDGMNDVRKDVLGDVNSLVGNVSGMSINSTLSSAPAERDTFYFNVEARSIKELNDLVRIAQSARFTARMGVT